MSGPTLVPPVCLLLRLQDCYLLRLSFPTLFGSHNLNHVWWSTTPKCMHSGLASFPFARRYLGNRCFFLFLRVLRCFSSPRFLLITYVFSYGYMSIKTCEFPHSEISGSRDMCSSPELIAACHVLLRLQVPRHPPNALLRLNYFLVSLGFSVIIL